ncbi:RNA-directed DNA polymerase, eukaryota [Tanacetum coccineum]
MNSAHPTSPNHNFKNLQHVSITIFVTNFPKIVASKDLWKLFKKHGVVADVYILQKLSKSGRHFGFAQFIKNPDQVSLLKELNKIWIGSYHLFASVARFDRKQNTESKQPYHHKQSNTTKPRATSHSRHTIGGRYFASILNGKDEINKTTTAGTTTKNITLGNSDLLDLSDTTNVVLAKVRDVHLIININSVLKKEGFSDFKCKYMGGLWLWIEFSCDKSRRMIWIEIGGLPLKAWTVNAFKRIAGNWGETVFVDEDADENIATGRVRVREFANWVPDFASSDKISHYDYESEASNNDDDIHSINEVHEEGEINDNEDPLGHQMNVPDSVKGHVSQTSHGESWADVSEKAEQHPPKVVEMKNQIVKDRQTQTSTNSPLKPPSFEGINIQEAQKIQPQGKSSRVGLSNALSHSHTKQSPSKTCQSTGSMIDNFLRHINMGTTLGYDMTGSQADLKKFIDSIGSLWGNYNFKFAYNPAVGRSGGLISIWDTDAFNVTRTILNDNLLIVEGVWVTSKLKCYMINVYVFGDFNVVRNESERIGSYFNFASATAFNDFILEGRFWDAPLGGHAFTRITSNGDKLSKLDRFLISEDITNVIHNLHATVIDCHISDHRPIVLKQSKVDFGPTPFKLFNSWMLNSEFDALLNIEAGNAGSEDKVLRQSKIRRLKEIDKQEHIDMSQKVKIKWGIEGDENTKFFHGALNKKRRSLAINDIMKDGTWLTDPNQIKDTFFHFFEKKFKIFEGIVVNKKSAHYNTLSQDQNLILKDVISEQEIRGRCGGLRQGDPLSPFLFILVMEGLSVAIKDAISAGLFQGATIGSLQISHLLFADDVLILAKVHKSPYLHWKASIAYPIDWNDIYPTISSVLGALGTYYLSLFPMPIEWKSVLAPKKYRGLRIGSLQALNLSLIQKWRWRYVHNHHALWVKVVSSIHGSSIDGISFNNLQKNSIWARIINSIKGMHDKGIIIHSNLKRKLNNGVSTKFWHDSWIGDSSLRLRFPRLFRLDS